MAVKYVCDYCHLVVAGPRYYALPSASWHRLPEPDFHFCSSRCLVGAANHVAERIGAKRVVNHIEAYRLLREGVKGTQVFADTYVYKAQGEAVAEGVPA